MSQTRKYIFLYKTTNLVNSKVYVGVHSTDKLDDGYIGLGVSYQCCAVGSWPFHRAVKKYGYENFRREILEFFDSVEDALVREREVVNEVWVMNPSTYNVALGGKINNTFGLSEEEKRVYREKLSKALKGRSKPPRSEEHKKRLSEAHKKLNQDPEFRKRRSEVMKGHKHTDETKEKISKAGKGRVVSLETRERQSESLKGRVVSKEQRQKISERQKGKVQSAESNKKRSETLKGRVISKEWREKISQARQKGILERKLTTK